MFLVALKIILCDKARSLITLAGVVFAVTLIFSQIGIYMGLMETSSIIIDHTPGDIWITSKNSRNFDFSQPFPEYKANKILSIEGVKEELLKRLKVHYPDTYIVVRDNFNKVRIPGIKTKEEGELIIKKIDKEFKLKSFLQKTYR